MGNGAGEGFLATWIGEKGRATLGRRLRPAPTPDTEMSLETAELFLMGLLSMVMSEVQIVSLYYLSKSQHGQPGSIHQLSLEAGNLGNMEPIRYETYIIIVNILYGHI